MPEPDHDALARDLAAISRTPVPVPAEIDASLRQAIRDRCAGGLPAPTGRGVWRLVPWAAAAAAIVTVTVLLALPRRSPVTDQPIAVMPRGTVILRDVDGNGRVDMLDAFALARAVEAGEATDVALDFNRDGSVDRLDADDIAMHAVSLEQGAG